MKKILFICMTLLLNACVIEPAVPYTYYGVGVARPRAYYPAPPTYYTPFYYNGGNYGGYHHHHD